jgi:hypothetical protein
LYSIEAGNPPWQGIGHARATMDALIGFLIEGIRLDPALLRYLSKTEFADLSSHPHRGEVWSKLETPSREAFLNATADGWLKKLRALPNLEDSLDPVLENAILSPARISGYLADVGNIEVLINVFRRFPRLSHAQFEHQLFSALKHRSVNSFDAILIGKLVMDRHWRGTAAALCHMLLTGHRQDIIPAVQECRTLLGWLDEFQLWISGKLTGITISPDEWWRALDETVTEIYPAGPEHVWERAGGDPSLINRNQSGHNQWREALTLLRKGGGGRQISTKSLLDVMCGEYWNNQKLQVLREWLRRS